MAKKKKNSNYQTEKRVAARREKERAEVSRRRSKLIRAIAIPTVAVLLLVSVVLGIVGYTSGWFGFRATHKATIIIENYGTVELELYGEEAPITVENFAKLANEHFYDGLTFHRIVEGFMAQGGDPDGDGTGGSTNTIKGEFYSNGVFNDIKHERGVISMARSNSPDSASSQFFIVHEDSPSLNGNYAAFGKVTSGMDVIDKLCKGRTVDKTLDKGDQPRILSITVEKL